MIDIKKEIVIYKISKIEEKFLKQFIDTVYKYKIINGKWFVTHSKPAYSLMSKHLITFIELDTEHTDGYYKLTSDGEYVMRYIDLKYKKV